MDEDDKGAEGVHRAFYPSREGESSAGNSPKFLKCLTFPPEPLS